MTRVCLIFRAQVIENLTRISMVLSVKMWVIKVCFRIRL